MPQTFVPVPTSAPASPPSLQLFANGDNFTGGTAANQGVPAWVAATYAANSNVSYQGVVYVTSNGGASTIAPAVGTGGDGVTWALSTTYLTLGLLANWLYGLAHPGTQTRVETSLMYDFSGSPPFPLTPGVAGFGAAGDSAVQMLEMPPSGSSLTSASFYAKPDAHTNLPVTMPHFRVYRVDGLTGVSTEIGADVSDPSANVTVYHTSHAIVCPITAGNGPGGTSEIVDRTQYLYYGQYFSESGTNSDNNTAPGGCVSTFTV
jgi:hypothetical protein